MTLDSVGTDRVIVRVAQFLRRNYVPGTAPTRWVDAPGEEMDAWLAGRGVMLAGGDLDESPMAYRRLPDVLAQHAGTVRVLHTLRPFAVAMAGEGEFDPFKD